jgi:hypothetical protein
MPPTPPTARRRLQTAIAVATGAAALVAATAPAANADSIAYVKDGNVWLSTPDGGRQYQVTESGGYSTVSQDDDGDMIATHGTRLHWLGRDGAVNADFYTPVSTGPGAQNGSDGRQWFGPFDPKLSPDGTKVAYHWYYRSIDGGCLPEYQTVCVYLRQGTAYSRPDQITSLEDPQFKSQSGWIYPTWVEGSDAAVLSDPSPSIGNDDLVLHTPYPYEGTDGLTRWTSDSAVELHDGEFDAAHRKMAYVAGDSHELLRIYRTPQGLYPYHPSGCYQFQEPVGGRFSGPTWSPDGSRLAWSEGDGVHVADIPSLEAAPCDAGATAGRLLIAGAASADWGPADVPAARAQVPPPPRRSPLTRTPDGGDGGGNRGGGSGGGNGGGGGGSATTRNRAVLASKPATKRSLASRGLVLKVSCARACRVNATLRLGTRTLGSSGARLTAAGNRTLTVRVSRKQRSKLLAARRPRVQVRAVVTPAGGKPVVTTVRLALK